MKHLATALGDDLASFNAKIEEYNKTAPEAEQVKLANLSGGQYVKTDKHTGETARMQTEIDGLTATNTKLQADLEAAASSTGSIEDIKAAAKLAAETGAQALVDQTAKSDKAALEYEIKLRVIKAGAKEEISVMAHLDREKISMSDGKVSGLEAQLEALEKSHEHLFGEPTQIFNSAPPAPPPPSEDAATAWQGKLKAAKESGSNLEVIKVKQAAAEEGVIIS